MSVSLSVHQVVSVQIERHEHDGHEWTKLRMIGLGGREVFALDVFSALLGYVEIVDKQLTEIEIPTASSL